MVAQITTGFLALLFATALMLSSSRFVDSRTYKADLVSIRSVR